MNFPGMLREIEEDLSASPARRVIYLEGRTDPQVFLALVGSHVPAVQSRQDGYLFQGSLVRGLSGEKGSGNMAVRQRIELASEHPGLRGKVFGITDGDGQSPAAQPAIQGPAPAGPLYTWPTYSIENQLVIAGWPAEWGDVPDWSTEIRALAPYVAVNRLLVGLQRALEPLNFPRYLRPNFDHPLRDAADIEAVLCAGRQQIAGYEIDRFRQEVAFVEAALAKAAGEMHALIDGKWLLLWAAKRRGINAETCRTAWCKHIANLGGGASAVALWRQVIEYEDKPSKTLAGALR